MLASPRAIGAISLLFVSLAAVADDSLDEIVVTADLRERELHQLPASATVLDSRLLATAGVQHFQDVISLVPNLNWSAGTSRPRFFQIRGVGELSQWQGAPNPSVGFLIDDIDFSGVGMPATLNDVNRIEVLRGPQGTAYGANALAGLIAVNTNDAQRDSELARPRLQYLKQALATDANEAVTAGSDRLPADVDSNIVPAGEFISDRLGGNGIVQRDIVDGEVGEDNAPAEGHARRVTLEHFDLMRGVAQLH